MISNRQSLHAGTENNIKVHDYMIGEPIGHGAFAQIRIAFHHRSRNPFAVKVISKSKLAQSKNGRLMLFNETVLAPLVDHPSIVEIVEIADSHSQIFQFMRFAEHGDLLHRLWKAPFEQSIAFRVIDQILSAVEYLHANGIVHRDIKLENFLIDANDNVKIADFGLSAKLKYRDERKHTVCGTPNYISPELLTNAKKGISFEADIWAVGVSTYAMLTGKLPFQAKETQDTYERIKKCDYQFPTDFDLSSSAIRFIQYLLNLNPNLRPTAFQLLHYPWISTPAIQKPLLIEVQNSVSTSSDDSKPYRTSNFDEPNPKVNNYQNKFSNYGENYDNYITNYNANYITNFNAMYNTNFNAHADINNYAFDHDNYRNNNINRANYETTNFRNQVQALIDAPKPQAKVEEPEKMCMPKYFVSRFCNHSEKYGLGYLLINGCVGACFKDFSRMIMDPHQRFIQYWRTYQDEKPEILSLDDETESRKIKILFKFSSSLKKTATMFEIPEELCDPNVPLLHVKYWARNSDATLFRMNDRNIQLNFTDRRKLVIFWNSRKLMIVSSIHDYGYLHRIHDVSKRSNDDDEKWRLDVAKQMLAVMSRPAQ